MQEYMGAVAESIYQRASTSMLYTGRIFQSLLTFETLTLERGWKHTNALMCAHMIS